MNARDWSAVLAPLELEAHVEHGQRHHRCKRVERFGDRARAGELRQRLCECCWSEQHRRPAFARCQPALEQLTECALAGVGGAGDAEQ